MKNLEVMTRYRDGHSDLVKAGLAMSQEVVSVNAGTPLPTKAGEFCDIRMVSFEICFSVMKIDEE